MRDMILNTLSMEDILNRYGIEIKRNGMFSCPFHGIDKKPSAKVYKNTFYCFACNTGGDLIRFVEKYFNLSFKDAMQKINFDFGLGLESNKIDYKRLTELKNIQNEKKKRKQALINKYCELCDIKHLYEKQKDCFTKNINIKNWEINTHIVSYFDMEIWKINEDLENLDNIISSKG